MIAQSKGSPRISSNDIRDVFSYIHRYQNCVFVMKIDDNLLNAPLFSMLIRDIVLIRNMGIKVILVAGAKNSINRVLEIYQVKTKFIENVRITQEEAMPLVKLGAADVANRLLTLLSESGANGVVGNWVKARGMGVLKGFDYENSGVVESINLSVVEKVMEDDLIPIFSNVGWSSSGRPYNISSDGLSVFLAKAIKAEKLFFLGKGQGIPAIPNCKVEGLDVRKAGVYYTLDVQQSESLLQHHGSEMSLDVREMVAQSLDACRGGVNRVHVINGSQDGTLLREIFSPRGKGTMFHTNLYTNIRPAAHEDIPQILHMMQSYVDRGILIQRSDKMIADRIQDFFVYSMDDAIRGCCALKGYPDNSAEIEAVVVDPHDAGKGVGAKLVAFLLNRSLEKKFKQVFVLTTQSGDYFMRLGFEIASVDILPDDKKKQYSRERNSKVLLYRPKSRVSVAVNIL